MNHLLSDGRSDAHSVGVGILSHELPIGNERMVKGDDIDVPQVSHVVTARKIGGPFRFACFYPYFA